MRSPDNTELCTNAQSLRQLFLWRVFPALSHLWHPKTAVFGNYLQYKKICFEIKTSIRPRYQSFNGWLFRLVINYNSMLFLDIWEKKRTEKTHRPRYALRTDATLKKIISESHQGILILRNCFQNWSSIYWHLKGPKLPWEWRSLTNKLNQLSRPDPLI